MARLLLLLLLLFFASPALAQFERMPSMDAPRSNAIQPELVVDGAPRAGKAVDFAILMRTRPGWHGYWLNPGDAGLPMEVQWTLPAGWSVERLRYPVPTRLLVSGIVNYVYEKDYAVLTRLTAPAGASGEQTIAARMRWLACTETICVPEEGSVSLPLTVGAKVAGDARFDGWRKALPRPLTSPARFAFADGKLRIAIPLPATMAIGDPYLFPATEGVVDYAKPQRISRSGDWVVAELATSGPPGERFAGLLAIGAGEGFEFQSVPGTVPASGDAIGSSEGITKALLAAVLGALVGGLLLNLMPCVFPILAMKALHLARAGGSEREARREALGYTGGAVAGTAALGGILLLIRAGGSAAGWAFQLQDPRVVLVLLLLATAITLNLLKVFQLPVLGGEANPAGSFGTGTLAAFVATPCSGPFMGAALGAALLLPLWAAVLVFAALGLGLALPFLLLAFIPPLRRRLPRPGPWMGRLQRFLAVPMAATAAATLWLLYRQAGVQGLVAGIASALLLAILLIAVGRRQGQGTRAWPLAVAGTVVFAAAGIALLPPPGSRSAASVPLGTSAWSEAAVARARSAGKPVFVYFTADWCLTCKANEAAAIDRSETQRAFRKAWVEVFVGDWTDGDPAIGRFLEAQGRAGVPLYLWYAPGAGAPEVLPQVLTASMLIERARVSSRR